MVDGAQPDRLHLARTLLGRGRAAEAMSLCVGFLDASPNHLGGLALAAGISNALGDGGRAEAYASRALAIDPDFAPARFVLGRSRHAAGDGREAAKAYRRVLETDPAMAEAAVNLGAVLDDGGDPAGAEAAYRQAIKARPDLAAAWLGLGDLIHRQGRYEDAAATFEGLLAHHPDHAEAHFRMGCARQAMGALTAAETCFRRAVAVAPDHRGAHFNLGVLLMLTGRIAEGSQAIEWRQDWSRFPTPERPFTVPRWKGGNLSAGTLVVAAEQGVGEQILHAGMVDDLRRRDIQVLWEVNQRLVPLFARSWPDVTFVPRTNPAQSELFVPEVSAHVPGGGLVPILRPTPADFPDHGSYLVPDPALIAACRRRYSALGDGLKVGIAWKSTQPRAPGKNIPLELWGGVLRRPDVVVVSLQHGEVADDVGRARRDLGVTIHVDPQVRPLADLEAAAAQIAAMDLVISVSCTTAHLAGAIGKVGWILLPTVPLWHWFLDRPRSLWYPSLRLFRQERAGDWASVLSRVADTLDCRPSAAGSRNARARKFSAWPEN